MMQWKELTLTEVINIKHGFAFKGQYFSETPTNDILLTPGNIRIGGGFKSDKFKYYKGEVPSAYILNEGDLIVSMTDLSKAGDTLGFPAKIPKVKDPNVRFLHNQRLGLIELKSRDVDKDFLYWLLRTRHYQDFIVSSSTGTTVKHTSPSKIQEYRFTAPPLSIQKAIAEILSSLDDKIELNNQINQNLEALAQAIFKRWFSDFEFPNENGQPYKSSGGEMVESELGNHPPGWAVSKIGNVMTLDGGGTPSTKQPEYWDGDIPWTSPKDLSSLQFPVLLSTEKKITKEGLAKISSGLLPIGSLLLSSRAPIGYLAITEIETAINQGYIAINSKAWIHNLFFLYWLKENMNVVIAHANGSTFLEISKSNFREIKMLTPSQELHDKYLEQVNDLHRLIVVNERESRGLRALRDLILPGLISGTIQL